MTENRQQSPDLVTLSVPSHPKYLYVIRSAIYPVLIDAGYSKKETRKIILAVDEACSNIIRHAYAGDPAGKIDLALTVTGNELRIELADTGKKPDVSTIAPRNLTDIRPGGLGTHFMNSVFESVQYDTNRKAGTLLTLVKKRN